MTKARFTERPEGTATMLPGQSSARNYYQWIVDVLTPYMGKRLLDIGSGYGSHLEFILPTNLEYVLSIDLSEQFVDQLRDRFKEYPNYEAMKFDFGLGDVRTLLVGKEFDTVICLNVLEHIENDLESLKNMHEILQRQNGRLLLQVPAHETLYGNMDALAGHYRRYSRQYLESVLIQAGFQIEQLFFFNSFGALPWFLNARVLRPKTLEMSALNTQLVIYDRYFIPILRRIEANVKFPLGQSLMAVARVRTTV